jgi:magnesium chelatase family protein
MSLAVVYSRASLGIAAPQVTVEVHLSNGLPAFNMVGLPETSVKESRDRVRSALLNGNFEFPASTSRSIWPCRSAQGGGRFDLAIAIGILAASKQIPAKYLLDHEFLGELALTGEIRPVLGVLPSVLACRDAGAPCWSHGERSGGSLIQDAEVRTAHQLLAVTAWLAGQYELPLPEPQTTETLPDVPDLQDVIGQSQAKRALEIAAAGSHNLLFIGPPAPARACWPAVARHSAAAERTGGAADRRHPLHRRPHPRAGHWHHRPYRTPHHSASAVALGGGSHPGPAKFPWPTTGCCFWMNCPSSSARCSTLREPLETGHITISRAARQVDFPARFQLVGAMNPSPCGHYGDGQTRSSPDQILRYLGKLSGPFLDRFDLTVEVPLCPRGA